MSERVCSFCNSPFATDDSLYHHEGECQLTRLRAFEAAVDGNSRYRDKISSNRRLQAELIVAFDCNTHQIRSFLNCIFGDQEMVDSTVRAITKLAEMDPSKKSAEDIAADAALIAEVRSLKIPVILEDQ